MAKKKNKRSENRSDRRFERSISKPRLNLAAETKKGIAVVTFAVLFLVTFLALFGLAGVVGQDVAKFLTAFFGYMAYAVPFAFALVAVSLSRQEIDEGGDGQSNHFYFRTYFGTFLLAASLAGLIHVFYMHSYPGVPGFDLVSQSVGGGYFGAAFATPLYALTGFWAACIILLAAMLIGVLITFDVSLSMFAPSPDDEKDEKKNLNVVTSVGPVQINGLEKSGFVTEKVQEKNRAIPAAARVDDGVVVKVPATSAKPFNMTEIVLPDRTDWKLPPFDLLEDSKTTVDSGNIEANVAIVQKTLADFGIEVEMGEVNVGPTVTQYTLRPNVGVKLSQIAALQNDLALSLSATSLRMELPIPGKALVGIEIPNKTSSIVRLRDVMQTESFVAHKSKLVIALGRDVAGHPVVADLAKMPHLLIAGATGTGKSVCINSILISLLYRNTPQDVKFIVVDPKRVELNLYNGIPHLLTPTVTDPDKAVNALKWAVAEMDRRYRVLAEAGKRNIAEYNEVGNAKLHYIVIIVDELADLMSVAKNDIEAAIVRLSQMARAVGIHLVLATQRPSVEVITGLIKANITSRIAFAVASQIDSRTILDGSGAEQLLGNGDMLFISAEASKPRRIQGTYLNEKEVGRVVDFFKKQVGAVIYDDQITEKQKHGGGIPGMEGTGSDDGGDELLTEATEVVQQAGKASASLLQRRLRVGYARAARLLDLMEDRGIIGPGDGAKPRDVYITGHLGSVADEEFNEHYQGDDIQGGGAGGE
jgi:S-DNA-T family DNA segregation ATPase FtsK/SpoIIIE